MRNDDSDVGLGPDDDDARSVHVPVDGSLVIP